MRFNDLPPLSILFDLFELNDDSPSGLFWRRYRASNAKPGDIAGTLKASGYWEVTITTDKQRRYFCHRIVFYMQTGINPEDFCIDHVDRTRSNNNNLRLATFACNSANQGKQQTYAGKKTTSRYKGVTWDKNARKWKAQIVVNYKCIYLGYFPTEESAATAYNSAAIKHFGQYANLNDVDE